MMTEKTLRVLEFIKIREQLATLALTPLGAEKCRELTPYDDFTQVQEAQEETEEALVVLTYVGGNPLHSFSDVRPYLALADKGAALSPRALLEIAVLLRACQAAKKSLITERENTPRLTQKAMLLTTVPHLEEDISLKGGMC